MGTFQVIAPDGNRYRITAPDDATDDQIKGYVQAQISRQPQQPKPEYNLGQDLKRQGGLAARAGVKALSAIPEIVGNAVNHSLNFTPRVINKFAGTNIPLIPSVSDAVDQGMSAVGIPESEGWQEKLVQAGSQALGGAGLFKSLGSAAAKAPDLVRRGLTELGKGPGLQTAGAITSTMGVDAAQQMGVENPAALMAIGAVTGTTPGGLGTTARRAGSGIAQAGKPFTRRGKESLVGEALNRVATNPTATAERLAGAREIVPGSRPMVSQVSQDPGMIGAESALRGMDERNIIGQRKSEQNTARMDEFDAMAGDEATLAAAKKFRDDTYKDKAEPAFASKKPIPIGREWINNPIRRKIQEIRETPAGSRKTVRDALDEAEAQFSQEGVDLTDAEVLYELRKDLALARDGKLVGKGKSGVELSNLKTARKQIDDVIKSVDDVIETGAPGFKDYLKLYAERSVPLDQLKSLQKLRSRAVLTASDPVSGRPELGNGQFQRLLRSNLDEGMNLRGKGPKAGNLSPEQLSTLDRIAADLDRGSATSAGTVRVQGSDTFKNMSVAAVIGRVLGDKTGELVANSSAGKTLAAPISFLYRIPDRDIQLLMLEAWTDPQLAARLMKQATREEIEGISRELGRRAAQQSAASALYSE